MTFEDTLNQAIAMLQRHGRLTYQTLQLQFHLDDTYLEVLKNQLLYAHPHTVSNDDEGLIWTGESPESAQHIQPEINSETRFQTLLRVILALLQRERRVTYRELKYMFDVNDRLLSEIREELLLKHATINEDGRVLVWTSDVQPTISPIVTSTDTPTDGLAVPSDGSLTEIVPDPLGVGSEPVRHVTEAERRQLTVMFCDLVGSTDLSGKLDPEDLREVVRAYQETAAEVIQRYDGHIAQYLGDGLLVYFGWPQARENDAERAVFTGLEIPEAIDKLNRRLQTDHGVQLAVRIGIHTGPVVVGEMGGGDRHENLALGETPNVAARLEGLAPPNTAIISPVTAQLVQRSFLLEALGMHELKGVSERLQLYTVVGPRETAYDEHEAMLAGGFDALVGRDEEIGLLLRRWQQSKDGFGQVVLISGEAGIGKSSLVDGLRRHVREEGMTCIAFRCSPYHTHSAFYPIISHVQRALGWRSDDTVDTKLSKLEQALARTSMVHDEAVPLVAGLLALPLPEDRYPPVSMSPQQQRQQTQDVLVAWLLEEAESQAVMAVWEDLHWADPSTLETLGLVVDQAPTVAMLHVLTHRPGFESPWPARSHLTPMALNRLERPQAEDLIVRLAGNKPLPAEVVQHIVGKTDGVPLYIEELTKMLLESDVLREETEQYALTGPLSTVVIPDTLQDSLMARLDQMKMAKEVAQLGSVLGREFGYEMLEAITAQDEETLQDGLAQLVGAELLYQRGRPPKSRYLFKHALIQDAAYASLLRSTRQQVHYRIAQVFEARFPETAETQPELLAHHFSKSNLGEQAVKYWHKAGQQAIERSANLEAVNHLQRGLDLLKTLPDSTECTQQELDLLMTLGPALMAIQGFGAQEVEDIYTRARVLCQQLGETPQNFPILWGLWRSCLSRAQHQNARDLGEQLLQLARRQHDPAPLIAALQALGTTMFFLGEFQQAQKYLEEGVAFVSSQQDHALDVDYGQDPMVQCLSFLSVPLYFLGYPDQALQRCQEALTLAQELNHAYSIELALHYTAVMHMRRREAQDAQIRAESVIKMATEHQFPIYMLLGPIIRGWAMTMQGQVENGTAQLHEGLANQERLGNRLARTSWLVLLVEAHHAGNRMKEGLDVLADALTLIDHTGEHLVEAEIYRLRGELLFAQSSENQTEVETWFHKALEVSCSQQAKTLELRAAMSLARLWQSQGKRQDAYDLLEPVYGWFTEGFDTADLKDAKALLAELEK